MMGAAGADKVYVEDVFSTWLYTGNDSTQTITNGIDLAGEGGLVWLKSRDISNHFLFDTARGAGKLLSSSTTNAELTNASSLSSFDGSGFSLGDSTLNTNSVSYASWTFRKAEKFFDVVTYVGDGTANRQIAHSLGSVPGAVIVKCTSASTTGGSNPSGWSTWHRSLAGGTGDNLYLNLTNASGAYGDFSSTNLPFTSTHFRVDGSYSSNTNGNGQTYVAYLFAHDAGGFGDSGSDSVIKCGSFTTSSGAATIDLGWEPQWIMLKKTNSTGNWLVWDTMRGWSSGGNTFTLNPNTSAAEDTTTDYSKINATGFSAQYLGGTDTYIYIAIRRGPMKTPTDATTVFNAIARTGTGAPATVTAGFAPDFATSASRTSGEYMPVVDKLRGPQTWLTWQQLITNAENSSAYANEWFTSFTNTGVTLGADNSGGVSVNSSGKSLIQYYFRRAPGFFDVVAYGPGTGVTLTVNHNLGVLPEWVIYKSRSSGGQWVIQNGSTNYGFFNSNAFSAGSVLTTLTSTSFSLSVDANTYIAYLFASCPGVSKVGTYTGTGTTLNVDCGFTAGARFVLIKRTDSTGDWYVWDTARGIISGNDPYLLINSTAAEVTNTDYIDPYSAGFEISSTAPADINANGGSYIFLAIA
jgi:hypothetical protein